MRLSTNQGHQERRAVTDSTPTVDLHAMFLVHSSCNYNTCKPSNGSVGYPKELATTMQIHQPPNVKVYGAVVSQFGKLFLRGDDVCFSNGSLVSE